MSVGIERELSAYRFVGNVITEITSKEEIDEIEESLKVPFGAVVEHINKYQIKLNYIQH